MFSHWVKCLLHKYKDVNKVTQCGGLNENGSLTLTSLKAYFPVNGIVWEGLGSVVLFEEVCH